MPPAAGGFPQTPMTEESKDKGNYYTVIDTLKETI
jgi:hypothetical protein